MGRRVKAGGGKTKQTPQWRGCCSRGAWKAWAKLERKEHRIHSQSLWEAGPWFWDREETERWPQSRAGEALRTASWPGLCSCSPGPNHADPLQVFPSLTQSWLHPPSLSSSPRKMNQLWYQGCCSQDQGNRQAQAAPWKPHNKAPKQRPNPSQKTPGARRGASPPMT